MGGRTGTAKACADGWALRDCLADADDIDEALAGWESQQLTLARRIAAKSRAMGEASQTSGTMVPGDPDWRFGLFGPGDWAAAITSADQLLRKDRADIALCTIRGQS